jgi:WhiB family transcriptional regulator, redox-sensing transcriptional regulator
MMARPEPVRAYSQPDTADALDLLAVVPAWVADGLCAQTDPEAFFPEPETPAAARSAKQVCAACPVRAACLEDALARGERHGVWGGKTTTERRNILRYRRRVARAGEVAA